MVKVQIMNFIQFSSHTTVLWTDSMVFLTGPCSGSLCNEFCVIFRYDDTIFPVVLIQANLQLESTKDLSEVCKTTVV